MSPPGLGGGAREAPLPEWRLTDRLQAPDGTIKLALALRDATVETVLIPADDRSTVCVSSQAGCTRHCVFCATATLGFSRALTAGEIVLQYAVARAEAPAGRARAQRRLHGHGRADGQPRRGAGRRRRCSRTRRRPRLSVGARDGLHVGRAAGHDSAS